MRCGFRYELLFSLSATRAAPSAHCVRHSARSAQVLSGGQAALRSPDFDTRICVTAQHREMVDQVIALTGMPVDHDLDVMSPGQTLFDVTTRVLTGMEKVLEDCKPDIVMVQGDTTTAMAAALAAFYKRIPVAHIEAGLRSHNIDSPFPEELNRLVAGNIATWHFAPTTEARDNLIAEGKDRSRIFVTGNTVIDTLLHSPARSMKTGCCRRKWRPASFSG